MVPLLLSLFPRSLGGWLALQEFSSHRDSELKGAEREMVGAREEAAGVVREAKAKQQEVEALRMEIEELEKSLLSQRKLVSELSVLCTSGSGWY